MSYRGFAHIKSDSGETLAVFYLTVKCPIELLALGEETFKHSAAELQQVIQDLERRAKLPPDDPARITLSRGQWCSDELKLIANTASAFQANGFCRSASVAWEEG